ncbi:MAG TPA: CheR family methyltransferase, partial [Candidatus Acidoferrum sp.]|nr:CheR family methyltransferase [Candidatus Acidoferrum sp.]
VSQGRLKRFFVKEEGAYRVKKEIREMIVFAVQNAIKDAPFTKIDFLSCRNFLIYVEPEMQNRLIPLFHYSIKPGGVLFLGSSESIGRFSDLFHPLHKKWKFFESKGSAVAGTMAALPWTYEPEFRALKDEEKKTKKPGVAELSQKVLLGAFAPPSVIVDERGDIIYFHGQTGSYLEPASGQATLNVLSMAREGMIFELRTALHNAASRKKEIQYNDLKVKTNGGRRPINLSVYPLSEHEGLPGFFLVSFVEVAAKASKEKTPKGNHPSGRMEKRIYELEQDLSHTKETLQTTAEEMQASNEELKSANEELQSTNEELQSTNEELVTVNSELQGKIEQLSRTGERHEDALRQHSYRRPLPRPGHAGQAFHPRSHEALQPDRHRRGQAHPRHPFQHGGGKYPRRGPARAGHPAELRGGNPDQGGPVALRPDHAHPLPG